MVGTGWERSGILVSDLCCGFPGVLPIAYLVNLSQARRLDQDPSADSNFVHHKLSSCLQVTWAPQPGAVLRGNVERVSCVLRPHERGLQLCDWHYSKQIPSLFHPFHSEKGIVPMSHTGAQRG